MPYIAVNTTQELPAAAMEKIKSGFGRLITLIPTKAEAGLLIDFSGGRTFYRAGKEVDGAFIDLRLFRKSDFESKKKFTEETFELLSRELGIAKENMYLNVSEFDDWGSAGTFKL